MSDTAAKPGAIALVVERHDAHRRLTISATVVAAFGLAVAALMALFGLPPIDFHGPWHYLGIMTPSCGATRAARLTMIGDLAGAWRYNPLGIVAVFGAVAVAGRTLVGVTTGRWLNLYAHLTRWQRRVLWGLFVIAIVLLEVRQQQRADLLMAWAYS